MISHYKLLNSFRPWWISYRYLPINVRPVTIGRTVALLLATLLTGTLFLALGRRYGDGGSQECR